MAKVTRIENGINLSDLPVYSFDLYNRHFSEAESILHGIAEVYGFAPKVRGLLILAFKKHDKFCLRAEHDQLYFGAEGASEPSQIEKALMDQYDWFWDDDVECWSCFT